MSDSEEELSIHEQFEILRDFLDNTFDFSEEYKLYQRGESYYAGIVDSMRETAKREGIFLDFNQFLVDAICGKYDDMMERWAKHFERRKKLMEKVRVNFYLENNIPLQPDPVQVLPDAKYDNGDEEGWVRSEVDPIQETKSFDFLFEK